MKLTFLLVCLLSLSTSFGKYQLSNITIEQHIETLLENSPDNSLSVNEVLRDFERLKEALKIEKLKRKKKKKLVTQLKKVVNDKYLKRYKTYASFEDLWQNGAFNEVTGTALYALLLESMEVSYQILIQKEGMMIMVGEEKDQIPLEIESIKAKKIDDHFEQNYLDLLRYLKLIRPTEYGSKPRAALFHQHFRANTEVIDLSQLAGKLSYNFAMQFYREKNYQEALVWARKAFEQHSILQYQSIKLATLYQLVSKIDYTHIKSFEPLFELLIDHPIEEVQTELIRQFYAFAEGNNTSSEALVKLETCYRQFAKHLKEYPMLLTEVKEIYYYYKARYFARAYNSEKELQFADSLYQLQPENARVQEVLTKLVSDRMWEERNFEKGLVRLNSYQDRFPFLRNQPFVKDLKLFYFSERVRHYFDQGKEQEGKHYLKAFEGLLAGYGKTPMANNWISTAYLAASSFYFRWEEYPEAREMIKKGLVLVPDDAYLLHRYEVLFYYIQQIPPAAMTRPN